MAPVFPPGLVLGSVARTGQDNGVGGTGAKLQPPQLPPHPALFFPRYLQVWVLH